MTKTKLLIVEDDEDIRTQLKWALSGDYAVVTAGDRAAALAAFTADCPLVTLLDLGLPPQPNRPDEGMAVLSSFLTLNPLAKVIVVSGQGEKQNALAAIAAGASDFLCKPVDMDQLRLLLQRCSYLAELEKEYRALERSEDGEVFEDMLGSSPRIRAVFDFIRKAAPSTAPVLILGESGTGKEMAAQALHRRGAQKSGPFVAINCNTIPENLLESELFGYERGAFTGANTQRKGHVEAAAGGTLFLDEIGELPLSVQVKLLRFLQEKCFQRVGGRQEIHSDVRILAATNKNLRELAASGKFREDLYFRLAVLVLTMPPLRERGDDILQVARTFLHCYAAEHGKPSLTFAPDALRALTLHRWPGNIRELQNRVRRAAIMADGKRVTARDLELAEALSAVPSQTLKEARESVEREMVQEALRRHSGKITSAAQDLGVSRPTLYELLEKLGIAKDA